MFKRQSAGRINRRLLAKGKYGRSNVNILARNRLQTGALDGAVYFIKGSAVCNFKLFIAFFRAILMEMAADTDADAGRNLRRRNFDDVVAEGRTFTARNDDGRKGHEEAVGADNLCQFPFIYILGVDLIVVDDRAQARTGKGNFCMRIFPLQEPGVHACGDGVLLIIVEA